MHYLTNIYLVLIFFGVLLILLRLHDLKLLLLTFVDTVKFLGCVINKLDKNIKEDELSVEERVNKLHDDIAQITSHMNNIK